MEANERRFRDLFEHSAGLVCTHDMDGVLLSANPAAAAAMGFRVGDLIGRNMVELVAEPLRPYFADYLQRIARTCDDSGLMYVTHREGHQLIWKYHNRVLRDAQGNSFVMGHAEDITERCHYEHRLEEQQAELEAVTDGSPIGLFRADLDGRFTYINRTFERIAGQRPDEAMRDGWMCALHPEDRARVAEQWRDAVRSRRGFVSMHRFRRDASTTVWTSMRAQPLIVKGEIAGYVGSVADVTARHVAEQQLARNEQRLHTIADAMPAMIAYVDAGLRFVFVNAAYARNYGAEPAQLIGRSAYDVLGAQIMQKRRANIERALAGERVMFEEEQQAAGEYRCVEITYIPQHDEDTHEVLGLHVMVQDITRKALQERGWMRAAEIDNLTGVANRAGFTTRLQHALTRSRDQQSMLAVMYLDIDHFKHINDTYGHGVGDAVIQAFAQRLSSILRPSDIVGRLGGDEFSIVMEGVRRPQYAAVVAAKVVSAMRRPFVLQQENLTLSISTSIGLALCAQETGLTPAALLKRADGALYEAKAAGRDGYRLAEENRGLDERLASVREAAVEVLSD
jgi:diguanylate cyclase (GGDEF)-like protein/PAS domain S-box-containing protein